MEIQRISLCNFRNYEEESIYFDPGINVIAGENAQGKTNLLEAVYMLCGGRSFRTRFDREIISFDRDFSVIDSRVQKENLQKDIHLELQRGRTKKAEVNGCRLKRISDLSETVKSVLFCPEDLHIIREGPAERRKLLDMAICQLRPGYAKLLSDYSRLLEDKTSILKNWRENPSLLDTLDSFTESMNVLTSRIIRYRASYCRRLAEKAVAIHEEFAAGREQLSLSYKTVSTVTDPEASAEEICREVSEHSASHRQAELSSERCLSGAHMDDLEIFLNGVPAKNYASQGQTRTTALSLKMAEREIFRDDTGEYPVLLLDDVLSELDASRREYVLNRIRTGQTLITCCEDEMITQHTGGKVIFISGGKVCTST